MQLPLVLLCADGNLSQGTDYGLLSLAYLTLHKGGVHKGSVFQVPVPAHCLESGKGLGVIVASCNRIELDEL